MKIFVVDPSLYTSPYDEHFIEGLCAAGVEPVLITRPLRRNEHLRLPSSTVRPFFYRLTDSRFSLPGQPGSIAKGVEHLIDQQRFLRTVRSEKPDIVHFQWSVLPLADAALFRILKRLQPLVLTMHDTTPFNGVETSKLQTLGFDQIYRAATHVIVHTQSAAETLRMRGLETERISVIPHGPLRLSETMPPALAYRKDERWTFVAFGRVRPYKGLDFLIDAMAALPHALRTQTRCIIAGEPMMDVEPLIAQIHARGLQNCIELRLKQHSESEVSSLLAEADCFVFPYLAIEASGVLHLVGDLERWMIASDLGAFAEVIIPGVTGELVAPGDSNALARALGRCIEARLKPTGDPLPMMDWPDIGAATVAVYKSLLASGGHQ